MYRYIRFIVSKRTFYDAETNKELGKDYIKIDQSWIITARIHDYLFYVISTSLSNANKTKMPSDIHGPLQSDDDVVFILKNTTTDWRITMLAYEDWEKLHNYGISDVYCYDSLDLVKIPIQMTDGKPANPIIRKCNYELDNRAEEENGFDEHYMITETYRRTTPKTGEVFNQLAKVNFYRAYIIQLLQDGTKVMYCENKPGNWDF